MAERTLTAMYDDRGAAEAARDRLVALGVPSGDVTIRGTGAGTTTGAASAEEDKGFWASLADLFAPEEDRHAYAEGLRRGGYLLSARVPDGLEDRASDVLERSGAVDIDERAESWRQSGWTGHQAGAAGGSGSAASAGMRSTARAGGAADTAGYASSTGTAGTSAAGLGAAGSATTRDVAEGGVVERAEEQLRVGKREVGGGRVRVRSYVVERPVEERVNLRQERVDIERRPVDRPVEPGDAVFQEKEIEASERGEEAVVDKQARWSRRSASARTSRPAPRRCVTRSANRRSRSRTTAPGATPASPARSAARPRRTGRAASGRPRGRPRAERSLPDVQPHRPPGRPAAGRHGRPGHGPARARHWRAGPGRAGRPPGPDTGPARGCRRRLPGPGRRLPVRG